MSYLSDIGRILVNHSQRQEAVFVGHALLHIGEWETNPNRGGQWKLDTLRAARNSLDISIRILEDQCS